MFLSFTPNAQASNFLVNLILLLFLHAFSAQLNIDFTYVCMPTQHVIYFYKWKPVMGSMLEASSQTDCSPAAVMLCEAGQQTEGIGPLWSKWQACKKHFGSDGKHKLREKCTSSPLPMPTCTVAVSALSHSLFPSLALKNHKLREGERFPVKMGVCKMCACVCACVCVCVRLSHLGVFLCLLSDVFGYQLVSSVCD